METHIALKNTDKFAIIDDYVLADLVSDPFLQEIKFFENLRLHSSSCVVFQKKIKRGIHKKGCQTKTIYLHKLIAERYLSNLKVGKATLVGARNGNKLDCRIRNLVYRSRSVASRKRKSTSKVGYRGVYKENNRYRAVISQYGRNIHIGMFDTPEEAALAYNQRSFELFGSEGKINIIQPHKSTQDMATQPNQNRNCYPEAKPKSTLRKNLGKYSPSITETDNANSRSLLARP